MKVSNSELGYLKSISDCVDSFLRSKSQKVTESHELLRVIERCVTHIVPDMRLHVYISGNSKNPFIMGIYPDIKELEGKSATLLTYMEEGKSEQFMKEWASIKNWVLEIDPNILTKGNPLCVDDGDQFVAILCHEIGHVLAGNPLRLIENYTDQKRMYNKAEKMILSRNAIVRKFALPMFVHTAQFKLIWKNTRNNLRDEIRADHYIPDEYREDMVSYVENHILTNPVMTQVVVTDQEINNQQSVSISFSKECIRMMRQRRDVLKNSIKAQYDEGNSKYMTDMVTAIGKEAMGYDPESDETNMVYENFVLKTLERDVLECTSVATKLLESTSVTPRDIAILRVQVDDINTVDQKLFIVHTIYDYLETLQAQKEKIMKKQGADSRSTMVQDAQISELNDILSKVMKIDVSGVGDRYGIFIKYPKGYEG